jgi:hypothetical protein
MGEDWYVCQCGKPTSDYRHVLCHCCYSGYCSNSCYVEYHNDKDCDHGECDPSECKAGARLYKRLKKEEIKARRKEGREAKKKAEGLKKEKLEKEKISTPNI